MRPARSSQKSATVERTRGGGHVAQRLARPGHRRTGSDVVLGVAGHSPRRARAHGARRPRVPRQAHLAGARQDRSDRRAEIGGAPPRESLPRSSSSPTPPYRANVTFAAVSYILPRGSPRSPGFERHRRGPSIPTGGVVPRAFARGHRRLHALLVGSPALRVRRCAEAAGRRTAWP